MKKARFFCLFFLVAGMAFLLFNFVVWNVWVEDIRTVKYAGGDLARTGYLPDSKMPRSYRNTLPKKHLEYYQLQDEKIDVLTIGDSFSNTAGLGEDVYYQDHIASIYDLTVLNITPKGDDKKNVKLHPHEALIKLINSGEIDRISPKYIILQSVGRYVISRFGEGMKFDLNATEKDIERYRNDKVNIGKYEPKFFEFISVANFKFVLNKIFYFFGNRNSDKNVYIADLKRDFFSVKDSDLLVYWFEDTKNIKKVSEESVGKVNDNLNRLADLLSEKGITLIFMPIVDKFDLYRDYLSDKNLPHNPLFDMLRPLEKRYIFVDTKEILTTLVSSGEKDVFFADDTHWSAKACRQVVVSLDFLKPSSAAVGGN